MTITSSTYIMLTMALTCEHFEHLNPFNTHKTPMRQRRYPYLLEKTLYMTDNSPIAAYDVFSVLCRAVRVVVY